MSDIIKHILVNAVIYIDEYSNLEQLNERQKGILQGIWICVDSIKNHLELNNQELDINIEEILNDLNKLIGE